ncbi:MAG: L,D-transpeptidase family protein [Paracoccaceae bacterium]|uniref:L,D-transpeptidase family protein n=1 Tax=Nonlabens ulvanivorans TaxID=906888 RepID=UPI0032967CDE
MTTIARPLSVFFAAIALVLVWATNPVSAQGTIPAFAQAVAEAASRDKDVAAYYKANGYKSLWTGRSNRERQRRAALLDVLAASGTHGLPVSSYDAAGLKQRMKTAKTPRELGQLEVDLSRVFLDYSADVQTGALQPNRIDSAIVRQVPYRDRTSYLVNFAKSSPRGFFRALPPKTTEYNALLKEKLRMERLLAKGGWGQKVPAKSLKPGESGNSVAIMRNRLVAMGYLKRSNSQTYDANIQSAVQQFQVSHGLAADGVAGEATIAEINAQVEDRLKSIIVALERERWMNRERGKRHVLVNIPDFTAKIVDNGKVTFQTRSVVGALQEDRPTPEFSDVMEFMVINPSWYVPRSIVTKEYLPALKKNPYAVKHIEITDRRGRKVNRGAVNFAQYSAKTFPFAMRQPPSRGNALGLVKFMFPNPHNIYLHDTPAKNLFGREVRAYSHGCVRLADPFDFAYALLAKQMSDPEPYFQSVLAKGKERRVELKNPVPVHLIYRTAFTTSKGIANYRRDIYGRDARIWNALSKAGVALRAIQS